MIQEYVKGNAEGNNESILNPFQDSAKNFEEVLFDVETVLRKYRKSQMVFDKYLGEVKQNQGFYRPLFKKESDCWRDHRLVDFGRCTSPS